jgi:hypothetical protein
LRSTVTEAADAARCSASCASRRAARNCDKQTRETQTCVKLNTKRVDKKTLSWTYLGSLDGRALVLSDGIDSARALVGH